MDFLDKKTLDLIHRAYLGEDVSQNEEDASEEPSQNEEKSEEASFKEPHGVVELHNEKKELTQRAEFYNGVLHGVTEIFDKGRVVQRCLYANGVLEGELLLFEQGVCVASIMYAKGKKNGLVRLYKGVFLVAESCYQDDVLDGPSVHYYPHSKQKSMSVSYKNGLQEGEMVTYMNTGDVARKTPYVAGKKHGLSESYYPSGELLEESTYNEDLQTGCLVQYYPSGVKKYERFFDVSGSATREIIYDMQGNVTQDTSLKKESDKAG